METSIVLLGNGINRAGLREEGRSWEDLLRDLALRAGAGALNLEGKPLPLAYEELVARTSDGSSDAELHLKQEVAQWMRDIRTTSLHQAVLELPLKHILTTNYDYALDSDWTVPTLTTETANSLFRARPVAERYVWHIHGECDTPRSILLGHDHYVRYTKRVQDYLSTSRSRSERQKRDWTVWNASSPLTSGLTYFDHMQDGRQIRFSWVDLFLRDNLHIVGFGCDFSELMMWWLLTLKARQRNSLVSHGRHQTPWIPGSTIFHLVESEDGREKCKPKLDVLKALGVEIKPHAVRNNDYAAGYRKAFQTIGR